MKWKVIYFKKIFTRNLFIFSEIIFIGPLSQDIGMQQQYPHPQQQRFPLESNPSKKFLLPYEIS